MKIPRFIACLTALLCMAAGCRSEDDGAVRALARRIIPEHEKQFRFERLTDTTECFELESRGSKIVVRGNSSASIAVGLNHYLKNYCLTTVSWHACNPVEMPAVLPRIDEKVRVESRARERFFLNYCTFGYTMPWWGWTEWERFIDWMALQGVTMPLAITGQEAVWQRVWTRLGLSDEEVRAYFTGPAHLPWHRMSNIDRWQGPLPEEWIDGQLALQQRILARERELGMKPVLPAFAGHVPQELKRLHPDARITRVSYWGGFDDRYRCVCSARAISTAPIRSTRSTPRRGILKRSPECRATSTSRWRRSIPRRCGSRWVGSSMPIRRTGPRRTSAPSSAPCRRTGC